ncbi:uncharacterized protein LOC143432547 [Xylocopa sonorina]|uniref:uncharacterized protein LOC143432547 n=1 Tax=Xylocopa sonorina TaxID=1818115 RepID=UPI00403B2C69
MPLPGGSTRIPPARAPAIVIRATVTIRVTVTVSNIVSAVTKIRNDNGRNSSESGGAGTHGDRKLRESESSDYGTEYEPRLLRRNRRIETRTSRRHRVTEKPQLLASTPRRKERGEE